MAGSWEIRNTKSVLTVVLSVDTTTVHWALGLRQLQLPGPVMPVAGMPFDHARNHGCMAALEHGFSHVFFLDSDVIPPPDAVPRLLKHNVPLISGLYFRRSPPVGVPVMQKPPGCWVMKYPKNKVIEVDTCGAGCLLISTDLLRKVPAAAPGKQWFHWRVDMRGAKQFPDDECMSEDFTFNILLKKRLGIPTLVDTGVVCKHIGLAEAGYATFGPAFCG